MVSRICDFYKGKTILITGGTGFIGSVLVEKILRTFDVQKVYLIARKTDKYQNVEERGKNIFKKQVFNKLDSKNMTKIKWIPGDLSLSGLAISNEHIEEIKNSVNMVMHLGASVKLNEPLANNIKSNLRGSLEILEIMKDCQDLKSFVYISTVYSQPRKSNKKSKEEILPHPEHPRTLLKILEKFGEDELNKQRNDFLHDWTLNYGYVKNATENLIKEYESKFPSCIFRPALVGPSYNEPFPGWFERMSAFYPIIYLLKNNVLKRIPFSTNYKPPIIPVDMTVNALLAIAYKTAIEQSPKIKVYNYAPGEIRPTMKDILLWTLKTNNYIPDINEICNEDEYRKEYAAFEKFLKNPSGVDFGYKDVKRSSQLSKQLYKYLNDIAPYFTNKTQIDIKNTEKMWDELSEEDKKLLPFDLQQINWNKYYTTMFLKNTSK